ncbi:putative ABC transporter permease subunit [Dethiothermospora halolimnae]|uniref:putative ABC transporter permease subunit n=1 Tax=Dethiothermospora halolimnae TaxID=3114390 RepID=UPI003CCC3269
MNRFINILKVLSKTGTSIFDSDDNRGKKVLLIIIFGMMMLPIITSYGRLIGHIYDLLESSNMEKYILDIGFLLLSIIAFVFGTFYIIKSFYFSNDLNYYLFLPIKSHELLLGKFIIVLLNQYLIQGFFFLPMVIVYGTKASKGLIYYMYSLIVFVLFPIVPLVLASIISMVIMRFSKFSKHKDLFKLLSGIMSVVIVILINVIMRRYLDFNTDSEDINTIIDTMRHSQNNKVLSIFFQAKPASNALSNSGGLQGILEIVLFLLSTVIGVFIYLIIGKKLYLKGARGLNESGKKNKKIKVRFSKRSKVIAYVIYEIKTIVRTPTFAISYFITGNIWLVYIIIYPIISDMGLREIGQFINNTSGYYTILISIGITMLSFISNPIFYTPVSRNGRNFIINKFIPISYKEQIKGKIIVSVIVGGISLIVYIVLMIILKVKASFILLYILSVAPLLTYISISGLMIDMDSPKLNWESENEIIKNNFNGLMLFLINVGIFIAIFIIVKVLASFFSLASVIMVLTIYTIYLPINIMKLKKLKNTGVNKYKNLVK